MATSAEDLRLGCTGLRGSAPSPAPVRFGLVVVIAALVSVWCVLEGHLVVIAFFFKLRFCLSGCGLGVSSCFDEVSTGEVVYNRRRSTHTAPTDPTPTEVMKGPTTLAPSPVPVLYPSPVIIVDHLELGLVGSF